MNHFFANKSTIVFGLFVLSLLVLFLLAVPFNEGVDIYKIFYTAAHEMNAGANPYGKHSNDFYKYSPTFLAFPLTFLSALPIEVSAVFWQALSLTLYAVSIYMLVQSLKMYRAVTALFSVLFIFYALSDLVINGSYLQSNTILVSGVVIGLVLYLKGHFVASAIVLAYFTNMKLLPIVLTLLLFVDLNKKFIFTSILSHVLLSLVPLLVWGQEAFSQIYFQWFEVLALDKEISMGKYVHFYIGLRPFIEANFDILWGETYFIFVAINALIVAIGVLRLRINSSFSKQQILLLLNLSLLFVLVFSPRTEGATLALMGPVYIISLWWTFNCLEGKQRKFGLWFLFLMFILISQSTSSFFYGTFVHQYSWEYNLRFIGLAMMYLMTLNILFRKKFSEVIMKNN